MQILSSINLINNNQLIENISEIASIILILSGILLVVIGIIFLYKRVTVKNEIDKERKNKLNQYEIKIVENQIEIDKLKATNDELSKVVHRDNHIMGALRQSIAKELQEQVNANSKSNFEKIPLEKIPLEKILKLLDNRSEKIVSEQARLKKLPPTGLPLIDGALSDMLIKANAHNIQFDISITTNIKSLINNYLTQTELQTLLCDHIKDAIIATEHSKAENKRVFLIIRKENNIFEISVKDNGAEFEFDVLDTIGKSRITTHKNSGGTGTGFYTTFETLKKYKASLNICEYKRNNVFTKSVSFIFDDMQEYRILSYRGTDLQKNLKREDVIIKTMNW